MVDAETLMRQAPMTVNTYANAGVEYLRLQFGVNVADPAQVLPYLPFLAGYIQACATDYAAGMASRAAAAQIQVAEEVSVTLFQNLDLIQDALRRLGIGNAHTELGAVEFLALTLKDSIAALGRK